MTRPLGMDIDAMRVEGKFKLSQNWPLDDRHEVVRHLEASADPVAQALGTFTKKQLGLGAKSE